jgi:hypothetical protein
MMPSPPIEKMTGAESGMRKRKALQALCDNRVDDLSTK